MRSGHVCPGCWRARRHRRLHRHMVSAVGVSLSRPKEAPEKRQELLHKQRILLASVAGLRCASRACLDHTQPTVECGCCMSCLQFRICQLNREVKTGHPHFEQNMVCDPSATSDTAQRTVWDGTEHGPGAVWELGRGPHGLRVGRMLSYLSQLSPGSWLSDHHVLVTIHPISWALSLWCCAGGRPCMGSWRTARRARSPLPTPTSARHWRASTTIR